MAGAVPAIATPRLPVTIRSRISAAAAGATQAQRTTTRIALPGPRTSIGDGKSAKEATAAMRTVQVATRIARSTGRTMAYSPDVASAAPKAAQATTAIGREPATVQASSRILRLAADSH